MTQQPPDPWIGKTVDGKHGSSPKLPKPPAKTASRLEWQKFLAEILRVEPFDHPDVQHARHDARRMLRKTVWR